jgi:protein-arginine kinase activator protein McsA
LSVKTIQQQVDTPETRQGYDSQRHENLRTCPNCGRKFSNIAFGNHLFSSKECMRRFWDEEEKDGAVRRRLRLQQARKAAAAAGLPA